MFDFLKKGALIKAIKTDDRQKVHRLLEEGVDANTTDGEGRTALQIAVENARMEIGQILLNKGAKSNVQTKDGRSLLFLALEKKMPELVKNLLDKGADFQIPDSDGETIFQKAVKSGEVILVDHLLKKGIDPNMKIIEEELEVSSAPTETGLFFSV